MMRLTLQLAQPISENVSQGELELGDVEGHTRIPCKAICTAIITRDILYEVLKGALVASLLALVYDGCHVRQCRELSSKV